MMIRIILLAALGSLTYLTSQAQPTAAGNFVIGTRLGFGTASSNVEVSGNTNFKGEGASSTQFNLAPNIGYFIANNVVFGLGMDYLVNTSEDPEDLVDPNVGRNETSDSDLLFGPFLRFYLPWDDDKAFFIGALSGFGRSKDVLNLNGDSQTIKNDILVLGVGTGLTIFARNGLALETVFKYNWGRSKNTIDVSGFNQETKTFTNAFDLGIGIQYYFGRAGASASQY